MITEQRYRAPVVAALLVAAVAGCAHKQSAYSQISSGFSDFSYTRNQTVALVGNTKRSLGASDINTLGLAYTALEEKANAYADFMVEAVTTSSFDPSRNTQYASDFAKAIANFNKVFDGLVVSRHAVIADAWVPTFAQNLQTQWNQYSGAIAKMSPQTKLDVIADLKRSTVWPNFENISTESVVGSR
jgi:hypothetical protein